MEAQKKDPTDKYLGKERFHSVWNKFLLHLSRGRPILLRLFDDLNRQKHIRVIRQIKRA